MFSYNPEVPPGIDATSLTSFGSSKIRNSKGCRLQALGEREAMVIALSISVLGIRFGRKQRT